MSNLTQGRICLVLWSEGFHIVSRQQTSHVFLGLSPKFLRPAYPRGEPSVMLPRWVIALMEKFNLTVPALRVNEFNNLYVDPLQHPMGAQVATSLRLGCMFFWYFVEC